MGPLEVVAGIAVVVVLCLAVGFAGARMLTKARERRLDEAERGPDDEVWRAEAAERLRHVAAEWEGRADAPDAAPTAVNRRSSPVWEGPAHGDARPARRASTLLTGILSVALVLVVLGAAAAVWVLRS
jgi:hypothetical protein